MDSEPTSQSGAPVASLQDRLPGSVASYSPRPSGPVVSTGNHSTSVAERPSIPPTTEGIVVASPSSPQVLDQGLPAIGTLPVELIARIFQIGAALAQRDGELDVFLSRIVSVCWWWREIACGTPSLWTNIHWEPPRGRTDTWASLMLQTKVFLERSEGALISVSIVFPSHGNADLEFVKELFHPHLSRCESLSLSAAHLQDMEGFLPLPTSLRKLEILDIYLQGFSRTVDLFNRNVDAGRLRALSLQGQGYRGLRNIGLISATIESLVLDFDDHAEWWFEEGGILGPQSSVQTLTLLSSDPFLTPGQTLSRSVTLRGITSLKIGASLGMLSWRHLCTPDVKHLEVFTSDVSNTNPWEAWVVHNDDGDDSTSDDSQDTDGIDNSDDATEVGSVIENTNNQGGNAISIENIAIDIFVDVDTISKLPTSFTLLSLSLKTDWITDDEVSAFFYSQPSIQELTLDVRWCNAQLKILTDEELQSDPLLPALQVIRIEQEAMNDPNMRAGRIDVNGAVSETWFFAEISGLLLKILDQRPHLRAVWVMGNRARGEYAQMFLSSYGQRVAIEVA